VPSVDRILNKSKGKNPVDLNTVVSITSIPSNSSVEKVSQPVKKKPA
jgi:hypothetical protein